MRQASIVTTWRVLLGTQSALVRGRDRIDAAARLSLAPLLVLLAAAACLLGVSVLHNGQHREQAQLHALHRVETTVLSVRDLSSASAPTYPVTTAAWETRVQWRTAAGVLRQKSVFTVHQQRPGDRMPLWVGRTGEAVSELWSPLDSMVTAVLTGIGVLVIGGLVLAGAGLLLRWEMTRAQLKDWTADWERVAQTWTMR